MDNASRCPQPHSHPAAASEGFVRLIEVKDRAERQRRDWITAYRALGDAGAVCRRFGVSRPTLRKWLRRYEREGEAGLRARSRRPHHSPALKVGDTQQALILRLRQERRLGVKRLRNELQRLHELRLSAATIHKVLARHGSMSCRPESGGVTSRSVTNAPFPAIGCRWIRARSGLASTSLPRLTTAAASLWLAWHDAGQPMPR